MGSDGPVQFDTGDEHNILGAMQAYEAQNGQTFPRFRSLAEAERYARSRSAHGGAAAGAADLDLGRVKRNVKKMVDMGAPETDIDAYISSEGTTIDAVKTFREQPESQQSQDLRAELSAMTQNPAKAKYDALPGWQKPIVAASDIASRFADGIMLGYGDELAAGIRAPFTDKTYAEELTEQERRTNAETKRAGLAAPVAEIAGNIRSITKLPSLTSNSIRAGHGLLRTGASSAADASALGAVMGLGDTGSVDERLEAAKNNAVIGGAIGLAAPFAIAGLSKAAQKVVSPFASSPERSKAVDVLTREGVETTAGQQTGSKALRYAEGEIGGAKAAAIAERQAEQFTAATLRRAGIKANRATPEVIDEAFETIGRKFDKLAGAANVKPDRQLLMDLRSAFDEYGALVNPSQRAPVVTKMANDIVDAFKNGKTISGKAMQATSSRLGRLSRSAKADPQLSGALRGMKEAVDDAIERGLAQRSKVYAGHWANARNQYRNMLVIEDAAGRAGEKAASGLISPSALRSATKMKHGGRNYVRGKGDFASLARSGEEIMAPLPDSGTASRLNARNLAAMGPSIVGAGAGGAYGAQNDGGVVGAVSGALAGFLAPRVVGQMMMTKTGQRYLANQLMRGGITPEKRELINRVLNYTGASSAPVIAGP
jgi:hypothetical protein